MNIVVTGATSFLGAALCKELVSRGHQVYAVVRPGSILAGTDLEVRTGKIQRCRGKMHWTA